jgi:hypothetical protein
VSDQEWVAVYEGPSVQANVIRAALDAAGFTVFGLGEASVYPGLAFDSEGVLVPREEAEGAREFLRRAGEEPVQDS